MTIGECKRSVVRLVLSTAVLLSYSILSFSQTPSVSTADATAISAAGAELHGYVNPLGKSTSMWFEWGTSTAGMTNETEHRNAGDGTTSIAFSQGLTNLQPHTTYYYRSVARSGDGAITRSEGGRGFTTLAALTSTGTITPTVVTNEANAITATGAEFQGTFNPGGKSMAAFFEWGPTTALGKTTEARTLTLSTAVTVGRGITDLQAHTTYYFRAVGRIGDLNTRGEVRSFTTLAAPATTGGTTMITTGEASGISATGAELHAAVIAGGVATQAWFEWGTTSLSNTTEHRNIGDGNSAVALSQSISGLQAGTSYYFRSVAQNSRGTVRGEARTFTTTRVASTPPEIIHDVEQGSIRSGYVIVTPSTASGAPNALLTFATVGGGATQSQAGIVPSPLTTDASVFVEVIPQISRNIGVALTNPGNTVNAVTLTLRDDDGIVVGTPAVVTIQPKQQVARFVNELFSKEAIGTGFIGSLRITSSTPFAALGLRFAGPVFSAVPVTVLGPTSVVPAVQAGVGGPNALVLGQFALSGGWATHVALVNNTDATITGRIDIFDTAGNPLSVTLNGETKSTFTYSIPAGGTYVLAPRDSHGQSPM